MEYGKEQWLNIVANFRKGELLKEATCGQEQFLRSPVVVSPLAKDGYKKLTTKELPHILPTVPSIWDITWDGVLVDESTGKVVLLTAYCRPGDIEAACLDPERKKILAELIAKWYKTSPREPWLDSYYGIAQRLLALKELNSFADPCFEKGWRCEIFVLNFTDEDGVTAATQDEWGKYYDEAWNSLFPLGDEDLSLFYNTVFPL